METIVVALVTFILGWDLISFCAGAVTVIGTLITLLSNLNVTLEEVILFSTLSMVVWAAVFMFIKDMFK